MVRKVLMTKEKGCVWTYFLEDSQVVEIHCAKEEDEGKNVAALGNIYIGKVERVVKNIGAAFIDIGGVKCYYDTSQSGSALFTKKGGSKNLCAGDELVVQVSREAVKTKAPTVSSNLSFNGRFCILTTGNTRIGVSAKIPKSLREEYKECLESKKNAECGIIVRTNAKDVPFEMVIQEIEQLQKRYETLKEHCRHHTCFSCLESAPPSYITDLKNVYLEGLEEILVEDVELYAKVKHYFEQAQPEMLSLLKKYADPQLSMSALYSLKTALSGALDERIWLNCGGYLVIQPTEGMTVIDVNSGKCVLGKNRLATYQKINLEAAAEIARQMRLRNLSGIIIVDFINMDDENALQELLHKLRHFLSKDPIPAKVVDITALQLVELTRKKVRKPLYECRRENIFPQL